MKAQGPDLIVAIRTAGLTPTLHAVDGKRELASGAGEGRGCHADRALASDLPERGQHHAEPVQPAQRRQGEGFVHGVPTVMANFWGKTLA